MKRSSTSEPSALKLPTAVVQNGGLAVAPAGQLTLTVLTTTALLFVLACAGDTAAVGVDVGAGAGELLM